MFLTYFKDEQTGESAHDSACFGQSIVGGGIPYIPATRYEQLRWIVLHEASQAHQEQSRVCAVNVAVVARDGDHHLLHRAEAATTRA